MQSGAAERMRVLEGIRALLTVRRWAEAAAAAGRLLAQDPEDTDALLLLALADLGSGRSAAALDHARAAVASSPEVAEPHRVLGVIHLARGELAAAGRSAADAVMRDPDDALVWELSAHVASELRDGRKALAAAERALSLAPSAEGWRLLAIAKVLLGREADASAALTTGLALDPDDPNLHAQAGWLELTAGRAAAATESFRTALRLDPEHEQGRQGLLEALRARNWLYRIGLRPRWWILRALARADQTRIIIIACVAFVMTLLRWSEPVLRAFLVVAVLVPVAGNLLLLAHADGRRALGPVQCRFAAGLLVLLVVGGLLAMVGSLGDRPDLLAIAACAPPLFLAGAMVSAWTMAFPPSRDVWHRLGWIVGVGLTAIAMAFWWTRR